MPADEPMLADEPPHIARRTWPPTPSPVPGRIAVVGPCAAGKSTLATRLRAGGLDARDCLQEHSFVRDMWRRISRPEVLIYLQVSHAQSLARNPNGPSEGEWAAQQLRLADARANCHQWIDTDLYTAEQVYALVREYLAQRGIAPSEVASGRSTRSAAVLGGSGSSLCESRERRC